ncbi:hypothetical protein FACS1894186_0450 [Alphaproteobacteria bacterium]|nr:hypothetical protein FACS1894186_0450 [Alphaproteobacteria bacterium]
MTGRTGRIAGITALALMALAAGARAQNAKPQFKFKFNFDQSAGQAKVYAPVGRGAVAEIPVAMEDLPAPSGVPKAPPAPRVPPSVGAGREVPADALTTLVVEFAPQSSTIADEDKARLDQAVATVQAHDRLTLKIFGYADAEEHDNPHKARQLSLTRALAVRSYLLSRGVSNFRMEIRALGNEAKAPPRDKAEVSITAR